ncbi:MULTISPECIES: sensor domain-containing diguanylate cyclase [Shewanella]|uniref:sensor domain-containing diguanylate cyclase n=1 Tax=Shewanella TaxID=22 RepID=UPI0004918C7A|nr:MULTISPECIES: GGDEF domain-containing protein [Shewanella]QLE84951.1 GGDEF domain-containing protein [Shewanella sp. Scap07]
MKEDSNPAFGPYPYNSILDMEIEEIDWLRWQRLVNTVADMFDAPSTFITQANVKGIEVLIASQTPDTHYKPGGYADFNTNVYCHQVVKNSQELYVKDASGEQRWADNPEYTEDNYVSYLGLPICWPDGSVFGTLCVLDTETTNYPQKYIDTLDLIKEIINSDLKHLYRENQLLTLSYTDPLTQIYNRRGFSELMTPTQDLAHRLNKQLILLYFDLDGFKQINDGYGHDVGDRLLQHFAKSLKDNSRSCDLVARWGGDEFLVLLHAENEHCITLYTDRLNQALAASDVGVPQFEYSVGYTTIKPGAKSSLDNLIVTADQRLFENKQQKTASQLRQ